MVRAQAEPPLLRQAIREIVGDGLSTPIHPGTCEQLAHTFGVEVAAIRRLTKNRRNYLLEKAIRERTAGLDILSVEVIHEIAAEIHIEERRVVGTFARIRRRSCSSSISEDSNKSSSGSEGNSRKSSTASSVLSEEDLGNYQADVDQEPVKEVEEVSCPDGVATSVMPSHADATVVQAKEKSESSAGADSVEVSCEEKILADLSIRSQQKQSFETAAVGLPDSGAISHDPLDSFIGGIDTMLHPSSFEWNLLDECYCRIL